MIVGSIKIHLAKYHCNFIQPRPKRCLARGKLLGRSFKSGFDFQVNCLEIVYAYTFDHLNIESLDEGLVAIDDILLTSF